MKFKKKLISATLSLVVATVLMASSSYAWFTISTNPEISKIKTSITANENIEIALDNGYENAEAIDAASAVVSGTGTAGNPYTWGNLLDMTTAMTNIGANLSLKPVGYSTKTEGSETKVVMKTPQYGLDGRVAKLVDMAQAYISAYDGVTTPSGGISIFKQTEDTDEADALALSFWLRSNADVSLMLSEGTYRADDGTNTAGTVNAENGGGSKLVLTLPEETAEKVSSIETQLNTLLADMRDEILFQLNEFLVYQGHVDFASNAEIWRSYYSSLQTLLSEAGPDIPLNFSIKAVFSENPTYVFSLEDMNELMNMTETEALHLYSDGYFYFKGKSISLFYVYDNEEWGDFELSVTPSAQLLRLLNKLKIRFVVTSEDGTQELYAKIAPDYEWTVDYNNREFLPKGYSFTFAYGGVAVSTDYIVDTPCFVSTKRSSQFTDGTVTFKLSFFNENDDGFEEYLTYLETEQIINNAMAAMISNAASEVEYILNDQGVEGDDGEISAVFTEQYESFLSNRLAEEKTECLMQFPHIDLSANEAKKVDVYMYLDGELITNADAITMDGVEIALNLQFEKIGGAENAMTGRVYVEESESESDEE